MKQTEEMEISTKCSLFLIFGTLYGVLLDSWTLALIYGCIMLTVAIAIEHSTKKLRRIEADG